MEDISQMTDETPSPKEQEKHPLLQKGTTIANYDATKGIFTVEQQQWTIHKAKKTLLHQIHQFTSPLQDLHSFEAQE
jgi:UDP-N-acetylglucosamine pyrophosphorylase